MEVISEFSNVIIAIATVITLYILLRNNMKKIFKEHEAKREEYLELKNTVKTLEKDVRDLREYADRGDEDNKSKIDVVFEKLESIENKIDNHMTFHIESK